METKRLQGFSPADPGVAEAARLLREGGVVAIPTETVYGLAADAFNEDAVRRVFVAKGRPQDNPLIVHISAMEQLPALVTEIPDDARRLAAAYWPGPLTMVLPRSDRLPASVSAGLDTVAVRMPSHPVARAVIEISGCPLAAPSANRSGRPSPTAARHVLDDLDGRIDAVLMSDDCAVGVESTVILLAGGQRRLLRPGGVTREMLESVVGPVELDKAVLSAEVTAKVSSPGMKYKHYAPATKVVLLVGDTPSYVDYVNRSADLCAAVCFAEDAPGLTCPALIYGRGEDERTLARGLFDALRRVDALGVSVAYVHAPSQSGVGLAVYNRLLRAAAFRVVTL